MGIKVTLARFVKPYNALQRPSAGEIGLDCQDLVVLLAGQVTGHAKTDALRSCLRGHLSILVPDSRRFKYF